MEEKMDVEESFEELNGASQSSRRENVNLTSSPDIETFVKNWMVYHNFSGQNPTLSQPHQDTTNEIPSPDNINDITQVDPDSLSKTDYHIYKDDDLAFSVTLSASSVRRNSNKFYIIQLWKHNLNEVYLIWRRWGRIGCPGRNIVLSYGSNLNAAITKFKTTFFQLTKNVWESGNIFAYVPGEYYLLEVNPNLELDESPKVIKLKKNIVSKLGVRLQSFLELVCDKKFIEENMQDMSYDRLGQVTLVQLQKSVVALDKIYRAIKSRQEMGWLEACDEFYTKIPHGFGTNTPRLIKTTWDVAMKIRMLETLWSITLTITKRNFSPREDEHSLDKFYRSLGCNLQLLDANSPEYYVINQCVQDTHGFTHNRYRLEIIDIFMCQRNQEDLSFTESDNKLLLWHGSLIGNCIGILRDGLRIAPPDATVTGRMFGEGVYFSDVASKSANYCVAHEERNESILYLCEVSLGNQYALTAADETMPQNLPVNFNSVFGCGKFCPSDFQTGYLSSEAKLPIGPLLETIDHEGNLKYNEYVVYDPKQIKIRYAVRVKFNFM